MGDEPRGKRKSLHKPLALPRGPNHYAMMHDHPRPPRGTIDVRPPSHPVRSQFFVDENVEKPVSFAGIIDGVPPDLDVTNRTPVLRIIDQSKQNGIISPHISMVHSAIFSLSVYHIKISRLNRTEDLIARIPIHEVAAICYIKDDGLHMLAVKYGTPEACRLAVLYCDKQIAAEEICSLVGQCFHLVYTNLTMDLMDHIISTDSSIRDRPAFISGSDTELPDLPQSHARYSDPDSSSMDSRPGRELLAEYMQKLSEKLSTEELCRFAALLKRKSSMPFPQFCEALLELYGSEKKFLIAEMSPFIPNDNYQEFEKFLQRNGIRSPESTSTRSSLPNRSIRRSVSELSTTSTLSNTVNGGDEVNFEHLLDHISDQVAEMNASVNIDTNPDTYVPVDYNN